MRTQQYSTIDTLWFIANNEITTQQAVTRIDNTKCNGYLVGTKSHGTLRSMVKKAKNIELYADIVKLSEEIDFYCEGV